jgi:hypothetical protein
MHPLVAPLLLVLALAAAERPAWVQQPPPHDASTLYFTGLSAQQSTAQDACNQAFQKAGAEILAFLGQRGSSELLSVEHEQDGVYRSEVKETIRFSGPSVDLRGVRAEGRHVEEHAGGAVSTWDCWVLVSYPRAEHDAARARLAQEAEARRREGVVAVIPVWQAAGTPAEPGWTGQLADVATRAVAASGRTAVRATLPEAELPRLLAGDPEAARRVAELARAGSVLVLVAEGRELSQMYGQVFVEASARWSLLQGSTGNALAAASLPPRKTGHVKHSAAYGKLLEGMCRELGPSLATGLQQTAGTSNDKGNAP